MDTVALVSYYHEIFDDLSRISAKGMRIIADAVDYGGNDGTLLIIPSVVFLEIFDNWCRVEKSEDELRAQIFSDIFIPLRDLTNVEIREIDLELLHKFLELDDMKINLENRDRIILATALILEADLITTDSKIKDFVSHYGLNTRIIN
ncbi:hypothetical protein G4Y79_04580 [Phototrophicus methaneseepsis]|uniref:PIN domain-containing protein n=1 Tax=Phototrophicus methaneseepsis TaxID=2710758 RepID=A0A7S8EBE6_9CHLR|nr:hypothetical protein [Phototrophicus methaneseepsis]QPC83663.1 hypothetical protein G4Y79_04580 [Phototrophicus methaneseepsis]